MRVNAAVGERASDLLRLAEADPRRSVQLATAMLRAARRDGDLATASVASRALGLAALHLQDPDAAIRHLRSAADLGTRAGSRPLAADARMRLAFALNVRGRPRQAVREIDAVLDDIDGPGRARALAQRGAIMHQLGRWDEALASYRIALPVLRQAADDVWVKRVLSNRGVLYGQRHEFGAAEADLAEAEEVCRRLDQDLTLAFIHQNLGWVCSQRGDVPRALAYLDQAERRLRSLRSQLGWVLADRGELLLSVGLVREAKEATAQAVRAFERERREIALPEIRLLLARTASVGGDPAGAYEQARRAVREFTRQQRPEWAALARFAVLSARLAGAPGPRVTLGAVERSADGLAAAGWRAEALDARILAGRIALARGSTSRGCGHLRQASRGRRSGPAAMRARGWHAEILLRLANDDRRGADRAIRAALRLIDEHRATFGATDLRAHASGQRVEIAELGLRMALADGRPERVLAATERGRASHLLMPPVRPPDDPALASDLTELRATVAELGKARGAAGPAAGTSRLARRQLSLERRIRDHTRRHAGPAHAGAIGSVPARELAESLGERVLVEFVRLDEALHAVTVDRGRIRLHGLGPWEPIGHLVDRIPFALRLLARPGTSPSGRAAAVTLLRDAGRRLDAALLAPLARQVGDRALVVVPTEPLHSLPWSTLPSCAGRAVTVVPSAALWVAAQGPRRAGHVAVVAGPNLSGAHAEAVAVAAIHATEALTGPAATVAATMAALDGARLAHLATHGSVHPDNPLFSALMLADGPLTAYDLERLPRLPQVVILASCDSGRLVVRAGDELLGLAATLLSHGARQIVASVVPVPDVETASLMVELHRSLAAGTPPAAALATVQANALDDAGPAAAAAAGFVCLGG